MADGKQNHKIISYTTHIRFPNSSRTMLSSSLLDAPSAISAPVFLVMYLAMINDVKGLKMQM
jgi:hypothetical protein